MRLLRIRLRTIVIVLPLVAAVCLAAVRWHMQRYETIESEMYYEVTEDTWDLSNWKPQ